MSVTEVILPKLGLTMDEGKLLAWRRREGDQVAPGEILFEVETDKAAMEVEAPIGGYLRRVLIAEGESVPVATVIALISTTPDEPLPSPAAAATASRATDGASRPTGAASFTGPAAGTSTVAPSGAPASDRVIASPAAKRRAQELHVDLARVRGSGPGGRITIEDVEGASSRAATSGARAFSAAGAPAADEKREQLSRMRKTIAVRMTQSVREAPQFSISRDVDMTAADALRKRDGVSFSDVILAACAKSLAAHPKLRSRFDGDAIVTGEGIHIGHAVAVDAGLLVPVLRDVDRKSLAEVKAERESLEKGAREGRLPADAVAGGVFSVSNLGTLGVDRFTAIVNPPEAAILALGRVADRAVAREGRVEVRPTVTLTLSVDHRVADGAEAARFLSDLAERLERAEL